MRKEAMVRLNDTHRETLELMHPPDGPAPTYEKAAAQLGINIQALKSRLNRARQALIREAKLPSSTWKGLRGKKSKN